MLRARQTRIVENGRAGVATALKERTMPIDWAHVNWLYVIVLTIFVLFSTIVGNLISFRHSGFAAILSAIVFAAIFVFWSYYPHPDIPLPTSFSGQTTPIAAVTPMVQPVQAAAPAPMTKPTPAPAPAALTTKPAPAAVAPAPNRSADQTTAPAPAPASPPPGAQQ